MNTLTLPSQVYDVSDAYNWILYLNPEIHIDEYKLVRNAGLDNYILIQDIRKAPKGALPHWLSELPVLLDTHKKIVYRNSSCIQKMVSIELPPEHLRKLSKLANRRFAWHQIPDDST